MKLALVGLVCQQRLVKVRRKWEKYLLLKEAAKCARHYENISQKMTRSILAHSATAPHLISFIPRCSVACVFY